MKPFRLTSSSESILRPLPALKWLIDKVIQRLQCLQSSGSSSFRRRQQSWTMVGSGVQTGGRSRTEIVKSRVDEARLPQLTKRANMRARLFARQDLSAWLSL